MKKEKKVIFIDRDGVINRDPGGWTEHNYVTEWGQFVFLPNSVEGLKKLCAAGYEIVVISNQAGVSKKYYTRERLAEISGRMEKELKAHGVKFGGIYYCIHQDSDNCECRKPKTGLINKAEEDLGVKAEGSFLIGDSRVDIEAGGKMGMKTILVLTGKARREEASGWDFRPDHIFNDLLEAARFVTGK